MEGVTSDAARARPMVGRIDELGAARRAMRSDRPAVIVVGGTAGIGKSRFVDELLVDAPTEATVLTARALPSSIDRPLDVLHLLLGADEEEIETISHAVTALACRAEGRSVIVVDDAHWADAASLDVLDRFTVEASSTWTLVLAYRPEALSRRLPTAELLHRLERREQVVHATLAPLDTATTRQLVESIVGERVDGRAARGLYERTGGNPLFIEELLRAADLTAAPDATLPWTLVDAMRASLADLDDAQRRVVEAVAVLGADGSWELLAGLTELEDGLLVRSLRRLGELGLVREAGEDRFELRHNLLAEAVIDGMLSREVRSLHAAAVDVLLQSDEVDAAAVTRHSAAANRVDLLVGYSMRGASQALEAGSSYQALQLAELGLDEEPDHMGLLGVATTAAWLVGLQADATGHARRWESVAAAAGDVDQRAAALRWSVRLAWEAHDPAELDLADQLEALLPDLSPAERARATAALAQHHMLSHNLVDAERWALIAEEQASAVGLDDIVLQARLERASALLSGARQEGAALLHEVVDEAEASGHHVLAARGLFNLLGLGRVRATERRDLLRRLRVQLERGGYEAMGGWMSFKLVEAAIAEGELARARALAARELPDVYHPERRFAEAYLALEAGDDHRATQVLDEMGEVTKHRTAMQLARLALAARAGDLVGARSQLGELFAESDSDVQQFDTGMHVFDDLIEAGLEQDELLHLLDVLASFGPDSSRDADLAVWRAVVLGDAARAVVAIESEELAAMPAPMASMEVAVAELAHRAGRDGEARTLITRAIDRLAGWPGPRLERARRVDELIRARAVDVPSEAPGDLTPREVEVVREISRGRTNGEIAAALYISPKTVSVHVSNVLAKLDMSSRTEVAAWAIRTGLVADVAA